MVVLLLACSDAASAASSVASGSGVASVTSAVASQVSSALSSIQSDVSSVESSIASRATSATGSEASSLSSALSSARSCCQRSRPGLASQFLLCPPNSAILVSGDQRVSLREEEKIKRIERTITRMRIPSHHLLSAPSLPQLIRILSAKHPQDLRQQLKEQLKQAQLEKLLSLHQQY